MTTYRIIEAIFLAMALFSGGLIYMAPIIIMALTADVPMGSKQDERIGVWTLRFTIGAIITFLVCWAIVGLLYYFR